MKKLLLAIAGAVAMMSTAFADDTGVAKIGDTYYETLSAAFDAVQTDETVTLLENVATPIVYQGTQSFTLDMNGKAWNYTKTDADSAALKVDNAAANITIAGNGSITVVNAGNGYCVWARQGNVTIENGTFTNNDNDDYAIYAGGGVAPDYLASKITIKGGTFVNLNANPYVYKSDWSKVNLNVQNDNTSAIIEVTGGTFTWNPANGDDSGTPSTFLAAGYQSVQDGDNWTVKAPVAKIGEKTYVTLAAAFADAKENDKIEMLANVGLTESLVITSFKGTFDLGGFELTNDESYKKAAGWLVEVNGTSDVVITNGTIKVKDGLMFYVYSDAIATIAQNTTIAEIGDVANVFRLYGKKMTTSGAVEGTATLNVYGTMTRVTGTQGNADWEMGVIDQCLGNTVVNVYPGAVLWKDGGRLFKLSGGTPTVNFYGGTMTAGTNGDGQLFHAYSSSAMNIKFKAGTFNMGVLFSGSGAGKTINVTGLDLTCQGKFKSVDSQLNTLEYYCAEGCAAAKGADGYYMIQPGVATIGSVYYGSLDRALSVVAKDQTIKLAANCTNAAVIAVNAKTNIVLDLNGYEWVSAQASYGFNINKTLMTITDTSDAKNGRLMKNAPRTFIVVDSSSSLTLNAGAIVINAMADPEAATKGGVGAAIKNEGTVVINGGAIDANLDPVASIRDYIISPRSGTATINGGTFNGDIQSGYAGAATIPGLVNETLNTAKFKDDVSAWCSEGYKTKLGADGYYHVKEKASFEVKIVDVGSKATITVPDAGKTLVEGTTVTGLVAGVAAGYNAYVFVGGAKVDVAENGAFSGTVSETSGDVAVAYVKDTAWYNDPFVRFARTGLAESSPIGSTLNASETRYFWDCDPGTDKKGLNIFDAQKLRTTLDPAFAFVHVNNSDIQGAGVASWRQIGPSDKYSTIFGFGWYSYDSAGKYGKIPALSYDGTNGMLLTPDWGEATGKYGIRDMNDVVALGDYAYFLDDTAFSPVNAMHKFVIKASDEGVVTGLTYVATIKGFGFRSVGRTIGGKDYIYSFNNGNEFYVTDIAAGTTVTNKLTVPSAIGSLRRMSITGLSDGTPHMIMHGDNYVGVWALTADGLGVVSTSPIAWFATGSWNDYAEHTYASLSSFDDETTAFFAGAKYSALRVEVLEKKPANMIVRGTFSTEAEAEDDVLVEYGEEAEVNFTAPSGKKIVGVKVNGVADTAFTASSYTFTDSALTKNVYIAITTEDVVAKIGDTTYKTLDAALAAVQNDETIQLIANCTNAATIQISGKSNVTLDLNGYEWVSAQASYGFNVINTSLTITDTSDAKNGRLMKNAPRTFIVVDSSSSLTLNAGAIVINAMADPEAATKGGVGAAIKNEGTVVINGGAIDANLDPVASIRDYIISPRGSSTATINGGTFNGDIQTGYTGSATIPGLVNETLNTAKFKDDVSAWCSEGYKTKLGEDGYYHVEEKVGFVIQIVQAGGKGTVVVPDVGKKLYVGDTVTGLVQNVAAGYKAYVVLGDTKVLPVAEDGSFSGVLGDEEGKAESANVTVAYSKDTAWYVDPFLRNVIDTKFPNENSQGGALDLTNDRVFLGTAPGYGSGGFVEYAYSELNASVDPDLVKKGGFYKNTATEYFGRSIATLPAYKAVLSCNGMVAGKMWVTPYGNTVMPGEEGSTGYQVSMESVPETFTSLLFTPVAVDADSHYMYGTYSADSMSIHQFEIVVDENDATKVGKFVWKKSWTLPKKCDKGLAIARIGDKDILYTKGSDSCELMIIDTTGTDVIATSALRFCGDAFAMQVTGVADGTPHLVLSTKSWTSVYGLAADGLSLVSRYAIAHVSTKDMLGLASKPNRVGLAAPDDEAHVYVAVGKSSVTYVNVLEKKPANMIVRGTFSTEAEAEDDVLIGYGEQAEVSFTAPAGKKITAVKVNGVADTTFTDTSYTFADAALTKNVYIQMTTEKLPEAKIGTTMYLTLKAAFDAAQEGDKIEMLYDVGLTECLMVTDKKVTLDLGGFELTNDESYKKGSDLTWLVQVNGASDFTVTNGTITIKDGHMAYVFSDATMTIAANATVAEVGDIANVFRMYGKKMTTGGAVEGTATLNIYGTMTRVVGTLGNDDWEMGTIDQCLGDTVVNVYAGANVSHASGRLFKMSGGTPTVNVYGGTLTAGSSNGEMFHAYAGVNKMKILAGTFNMGNFLSGSGSDKTINVSGLNGTCQAKFSTTASNLNSLGYYCDEGYAPIKGEDGYYTIGVPKVQVGTQFYLTLNDALKAATTGDEVKLLDNATLSGALTIGKAVGINLNGKTLTPDPATTIGITITADAAITNGTIASALTANVAGSVLVEIDDADVLFQDLTVDAAFYEYGIAACANRDTLADYYTSAPAMTVTCKNVAVTGNGALIYAQCANLTLDDKCSAIYNEGPLFDNESHRAAIYSAVNATVTIAGGEYTHEKALLSGNLGGKIIANGGTFNGQVYSWMDSTAHDDLEQYEDYIAQFLLNGGTYEGEIAFFKDDDDGASRELDYFKKGDDADVSALTLPDEYKWDAEGVLVKETGTVVAKIGEVEYTNLRDALVACQANETVQIVADIDLNNAEWTPVEDAVGTVDGGIYDENGVLTGRHVIKNLKVTKDGNYAGMFGNKPNTFSTSLNIKNITFENIDLKGKQYVGVVAEWTGMGSNVVVTGTIKVVGTKYVAALAAHGYVNLFDCHVDGLDKSKSSITQTGSSQVGALIGIICENHKAVNCTAKNLTITGVVSVGGLIGRVLKSHMVLGCQVADVDIVSDDTSLNKTAAIVGEMYAGSVEFFANNTFSGVTINGASESLPKFGYAGSGSSIAYTTKDDAVWDEAYKFSAGTFAIYGGETTLNALKNQVVDGYEVVDGEVEGTYVVQAKPAAYAITIVPTENGTVTASAETALEGETVTLTVTPSDGYTLDTLAVSNADETVEIEVTDKTFTMPANAVKVYATFKTYAAPTVDEGTGPMSENPPEIKKVDGKDNTYAVEVNSENTTAVKVNNLPPDVTLVVPAQVDTVNGAQNADQIKVYADATNESVKVEQPIDISPAFTITVSEGIATISLNAEAEVPVTIGGETEKITVVPALSSADDTVKPLVVSDTAVDIGVKTIPGLKYQILTSETVGGTYAPYGESFTAKGTRMALQAFKDSEKANSFYKIEVSK